MNIKLSLLALLCIISFSVLGQNIKTDTINVSGNCGMCKTTIEKSLKKKDGITAKDWNQETKTMVVSYDALKISLDEIHKKIAASGYDTDRVQADDKVYSNLHKCCQYERVYGKN